MDAAVPINKKNKKKNKSSRFYSELSLCIRVLEGFFNEIVEAVDFLRRKIMFVGFVGASNETFLDDGVLVHANNLDSFITCLDQLLKR